MIRIIGKIRKKVILIDNFIQSFYLFCTCCFNPNARYL